MKKILFISSSKKNLEIISDFFISKNIYDVSFAENGKKACEKIKNDFFTLAVLDEKLEDCTGIELAENIIKINAVTNTAVISSLSDEDFHEESEGLGILMKLPQNPSKETAEKLEKYLLKILGL